MKKILNNKKGFTLVELIIVIAVIAILAAIAIPNFMRVMTNAAKADTISMARNAYSLAQIELLNDKIDGKDARDGDAIEGVIASEVGVDTTEDSGEEIEIVVDQGKYTVTSATITANDFVIKVTNGKVEDITPAKS